MSRTGEFLAASAVLALLCLAVGCQAPTGQPSDPDRLNAMLAPCADRLHDLCGQLLLYYSAHKALPQKLADLGGAGSAPPLVCPVSGKPYLYNRDGLEAKGTPGRLGRLIVYDPEPCHSGTGWGIAVEPPQPGKPLVFRVVHPPAQVYRAPPRP